ncbi:MAG TPA: hypothetical protein VLE74_04465 [Candidatus Saccharimonadales bacterium]|nr:hypothetical protein [Candidatus Saccharimonadales bacterium]
MVDKNNRSLTYSICVSGAAHGDTVDDDKQLAARLGAAIAHRGHITTTGATIGLPYFAAKAAKEAGGVSIGFSPAVNVREHMRKYRLPRDYFDFINFTGMNYVGRDFHLIQSSDAIITVGGRFGSLHEFVTALEAHKPCGILIGSDGAADIIPELMKVLDPPREHLVIYDENPENLVERITTILDKEYADVIEQLKRNEHWFLNGNHQG